MSCAYSEEVPGEQSGETQHSTRTPTSGPDETARPSSGPQSMPGMTQRVRVTRDRLKSHPVTNQAYRITVGIVGALVVVIGLILVPFPGPGWLIVIVGLFILASEFVWAQRLLGVVREQVRRWTEWISAQSAPVRLAVAVATFAFVACVLWGVAVLIGVPSWVPGRLVPPLPGLEEFSDWV